MATSHALVTLSSSDATRLTPDGLHSGMDITIQNVHASAIVYVGGEGVTSSNYGYKLVAGSAVAWELPGRDELYAITDTNNSKIAILKTSLEVGA
jgi:hypothetical protein